LLLYNDVNLYGLAENAMSLSRAEMRRRTKNKGKTTLVAVTIDSEKTTTISLKRPRRDPNLQRSEHLNLEAAHSSHHHLIWRTSMSG